MTNQLIPVFSGTISNETIQLCNARDLHAFLEVGKMFTHWIKSRITEYGFAEKQDYILTVAKTGKRLNVVRHDYHLTLDTAKELAMVERNEKGRQIRRYFIECEKRLKGQAVLQANPPVPTTVADRAPLREAAVIRARTHSEPLDKIYTRIHQRFGVTCIANLTREQLAEALADMTGRTADTPPPPAPLPGALPPAAYPVLKPGRYLYQVNSTGRVDITCIKDKSLTDGTAVRALLRDIRQFMRLTEELCQRLRVLPGDQPASRLQIPLKDSV